MDFIKDSGLREKIKNAMNYSAWLYKFINESEQDDLIKEESYRVIILYVHSCIEATLINFYENYVLEKIEYKEYTNIQVLNEIYQNKNNLNSFSVLAIQT